jgi:hypothetical protein
MALGPGRWTHATLYVGTLFESLLWMLQHDICVVIGEDYAIYAPGDGHEQSTICQFLDSALEELPDLDIRDSEELLFQDRRTHRQLQNAIKRMVPGDPSTVGSTNFPCAR